eukprot:2212261-Prymnesium_polylepis.1
MFHRPVDPCQLPTCSIVLSTCIRWKVRVAGRSKPLALHEQNLLPVVAVDESVVVAARPLDGAEPAHGAEQVAASPPDSAAPAPAPVQPCAAPSEMPEDATGDNVQQVGAEARRVATPSAAL